MAQRWTEAKDSQRAEGSEYFLVNFHSHDVGPAYESGRGKRLGKEGVLRSPAHLAGGEGLVIDDARGHVDKPSLARALAQGRWFLLEHRMG